MATAATTDDKKPARRVAPKATSAKAASTKPAAKAATARAKAPKLAKPPAAKPAAKPAAAQPANRQSRDSSMTGKEHDEHVERIWELARRIGIAMFVTWDGKQQRARPLAATVEKDEGAIYFLTDVNGQKDEQVSEYPWVSVSFVDHKHARYVALSGKATVSNDRARIKELWTPFAKARWDSPEDPAIRVIKLVPHDAELWDSPGRIVTTLSMLTAAVTGRSPRIGENAKVVL
ncbi:pyridoxamine 5'-phosphate oxidase family protein [Devosia sp.]|uniref:pyridoxamine 5'-phosphate oxidase family protein n=1 Tax=Devosia sp. TaxID=1871048 RepID=UPI002FC70FD1